MDVDARVEPMGVDDRVEPMEVDDRVESEQLQELPQKRDSVGPDAVRWLS